MNWGLGLFRIWCVLAVIWAIPIGLGAYLTYASSLIESRDRTPQEVQECQANKPKNVFDCYDTLATSRPRPFTSQDFLTFGLGYILPVGAVFLMGWAGLWIGRGFRRVER